MKNLRKSMFVTCIAFILSMCFSVTAFATDISSTDNWDTYAAIVDEINETYGTDITLCNIPQNRTPTEFRDWLMRLAESDAKASVTVESAQRNRVTLDESNVLASKVYTADIGAETSDGYLKLCCRDVEIGYIPALQGDGFVSANAANVYAEQAHPFLHDSVTYSINDRGVSILDHHVTLDIWATGDLRVYENGIKIIDWPDHDTSVGCTIHDEV